MAAQGGFDFSRLVVRVARPEDHSGVCSITPNLYDGIDYLPDMYLDYLQDPYKVVFVGEVDRRIVSYISSCILLLYSLYKACPTSDMTMKEVCKLPTRQAWVYVCGIFKHFIKFAPNMDF